MADWADVKDMYEVGSREEPKNAQEPAPEQLPFDPRCMRVELPGLPRFMTLPIPLQRLARKKEYIVEIQRAFADRADRLDQDLTQIHGGQSTAELRLTVHVTPPGGIPCGKSDRAAARAGPRDTLAARVSRRRPVVCCAAVSADLARRGAAGLACAAQTQEKRNFSLLSPRPCDIMLNI